MFKLSWANVSARGIELRIAKSGRGNSQRGASRVIFMLTAELSKILARAKVLAGEEKNIFVSPTKRAITTSLFSNAWRQVWERVRKDGNDLEYFREHDIRAKTATDAEEFGQDATALLTHADKKTTAAYLRGRASKKITPLR